MDNSAVNVNVTVDDFDSVLSYPDQSVWQTPDPSSPSFNASATPWWMGTFHKTEVVGASVNFNFTGMSRMDHIFQWVLNWFLLQVLQFSYTGIKVQPTAPSKFK